MNNRTASGGVSERGFNKNFLSDAVVRFVWCKFDVKSKSFLITFFNRSVKKCNEGVMHIQTGVGFVIMHSRVR